MEATATNLGQVKARRATSLQKAWYRFTRRRAAVAGLIFIVFEIVFTLTSPLLVKAKLIYGPYYYDYAATYQGPSIKHLFGTDDFGRDVLSRVIYGAQVSYAVGVGGQLIITVLGLAIGSLAGLAGGWVDYLVMRVIDILSSVPGLLFYLLLMIVLGAGLPNVILALSITGWIGVARLVRGQVLSHRSLDYCFIFCS